MMGRASITVSLPTTMLAEVDRRVEEGEFDDRSAAIEAGVGELLVEGGDNEP